MPALDLDGQNDHNVIRGCRDERVVAACGEIREWLSSSVTSKTAKPKSGMPPPGDCTTPPPSKDARNMSDQRFDQMPTTPSASHLDLKEHLDCPSTIAGSQQALDDAQTNPDSDNDQASAIDSEGPAVNNGDGLDEKADAGDQHNLELDLSICRVGEWLIETSDPPSVSAENIQEEVTKDIDTCTGELLPEIAYPLTWRRTQDGPDQGFEDLAWRQANMSAAIYIQNEAVARKNIAEAVRAQVQDEVTQTLTTKQIETAVQGSEEEIPWPRADCIIRPVEPRDFTQIINIMYLESAMPECPQIIKGKGSIKYTEMQDMYFLCHKFKQPFIVATAPHDELSNPSRRPEAAGKGRKGGPGRKHNQPNIQQTVLGFALVKDSRCGTLTGPSEASRFSCQIRMAVHPEHRRAKIGTALLDRILLCVAPYHKSVVDYVWRCERPGLIYEALPSNNHRQYNWVYVENLSAASARHGEAREAHAWREEFLGKFGFELAARFKDAVRTNRSYDSEWLDLSLWALQAQPTSNIHDRSPEALQTNNWGSS